MRVPRVRFRVRRMMVIPVFVAATLVAWVTVDRLRRGPYRARLEGEVKWSQNPSARFFPPLKGYRRPEGKFIWLVDGLNEPAPTCFLKISYLEGPDRQGRYYEQRWAFGQGGE